MDEVGDSDRVKLIADDNCMRLKSVIGKCRFFIGTRTHATIAAYSQSVPTLVAGYSTKSAGIARDLFGTENHYVIPITKLTTNMGLAKEFDWLQKNEESKKTIEETDPGI